MTRPQCVYGAFAVAVALVLVGVTLASPTAALQTGSISIVSTGPQGYGNGRSDDSDISGDGRFVAFSSFASNLVANDTNQQRDVFVRDFQQGVTERVSVASDGSQTQFGGSWDPAITDDGRFIAFYSVAPNLDIGTRDAGIYVHDRITGTTEMVSVNDAGKPADGPVYTPEISADGRLVAFESQSSNLVPDIARNCGDDPFPIPCIDVYVRDRLAKTTRRVSVSSEGEAGDRSSFGPSVSASGRYVAFTSVASNLTPNIEFIHYNVFVHDLKTSHTELVSKIMRSGLASGASSGASISANGRFVAFNSEASNLIAGDQNVYCPPSVDYNDDDSLYNCQDIFVTDRRTGRTSRVSVGDSGVEANGFSGGASISASGRFVSFSSAASNLVPGDFNEESDVFVHDRVQGSTVRVSASDAGDAGNALSVDPHISADGRSVSFQSWANNLVPNDTQMCGILNCIDIFRYTRSAGD